MDPQATWQEDQRDMKEIKEITFGKHKYPKLKEGSIEHLRFQAGRAWVLGDKRRAERIEKAIMAKI